MKETGMIFNAEMVEAILSGRKTQTRRTVKKNLSERFDPPRGIDDVKAGYPLIQDNYGDSFSAIRYCPFGKVGDRIWVRETFHSFTDALTMETCTVYRATDGYDCKWTPAIHMPRNASRITLEITNVRCEKLLDITEEDAIAEGLPAVSIKSYNGIVLRPAAFAFRELWMSIYGATSWDSNPYIWVIEFKVLEWK